MGRKVEGMMWWVRDQKAMPDEQVREAVAYYVRKYRQVPNVCFVNPVDFVEKEFPEEVDGIAVRPDKDILREHFWVCDHSDEPNDSEFGKSSQTSTVESEVN